MNQRSRCFCGKMIFDQTRLFQVLGYAGLKNFSFSFMVVKSNLGEEKHMKIAERIERLGTETAFAVSAEAAAFAAKGNKVYPFHLGDMNIITPANVRKTAMKAMNEGKTGYCPNTGIPQL